MRLYIVGRNLEAAAIILADCPKICPQGDFNFIKAGDLSLLRDVDEACTQLEQLETELAAKSDEVACIDLLFMSHADFHLGSRRGITDPLELAPSTMTF